MSEIVKYFSVDVLVNGRLVVEINSNTHYREVEGQWQLNLKSSFRERMIREWGHEYHNLRVDDYTSSSYNMLEKIEELKELAKKPQSDEK